VIASADRPHRHKVLNAFGHVTIVAVQLELGRNWYIRIHGLVVPAPPVDGLSNPERQSTMRTTFEVRRHLPAGPPCPGSPSQAFITDDTDEPTTPASISHDGRRRAA
jgi:hypothetical protein